jgi:hypothetical protein
MGADSGIGVVIYQCEALAECFFCTMHVTSPSRGVAGGDGAQPTLPAFSWKAAYSFHVVFSMDANQHLCVEGLGMERAHEAYELV